MPAVGGTATTSGVSCAHRPRLRLPLVADASLPLCGSNRPERVRRHLPVWAHTSPTSSGLLARKVFSSPGTVFELGCLSICRRPSGFLRMFRTRPQSALGYHSRWSSRYPVSPSRDRASKIVSYIPPPCQPCPAPHPAGPRPHPLCPLLAQRPPSQAQAPCSPCWHPARSSPLEVRPATHPARSHPPSSQRAGEEDPFASSVPWPPPTASCPWLREGQVPDPLPRAGNTGSWKSWGARIWSYCGAAGPDSLTQSFREGSRACPHPVPHADPG